MKMTCKSCEKKFETEQSRRRYCDECRKNYYRIYFKKTYAIVGKTQAFKDYRSSIMKRYAQKQYELKHKSRGID